MSETTHRPPVVSASSQATEAGKGFFDAIGLELQQALCSNETEPMEHRIARLEGVREALANMGDVTEKEAMLMTQMIATHFTAMACLKGAGKVPRDVATSSKLHANAASMMGTYAQQLRLSVQLEAMAAGRLGLGRGGDNE